jgi:hypothetical protein
VWGLGWRDRVARPRLARIRRQRIAPLGSLTRRPETPHATTHPPPTISGTPPSFFRFRASTSRTPHPNSRKRTTDPALLAKVLGHRALMLRSRAFFFRTAAFFFRSPSPEERKRALTPRTPPFERAKGDRIQTTRTLVRALLAKVLEQRTPTRALSHKVLRQTPTTRALSHKVLGQTLSTRATWHKLLDPRRPTRALAQGVLVQSALID